MVKVMAVYDEDPLYAGRLAEYVNQKETFPFQAMAFSDLEKLKEYGQTHDIEILLAGENVREKAKEVKAGLKMILCDGEFVSKGEAKEEASVYKYQSGDCILQEEWPVTALHRLNQVWHLWERAVWSWEFIHRWDAAGKLLLHWLWLICWERARQFYLSAWRNIPVFQSWSAGDMSRIFQMYFICIRGEILTGLN